MEFHNEFDPEADAVDMTVADITLRGIYNVKESGGGLHEEYKAERERESGGQDALDEPPAAELQLIAWAEWEQVQAINELRERREPFPVSVGPFVFEEMGITSFEAELDGSLPEAYALTLQLQEFRELIIQRRSLDEVFGGGGATGPGTDPNDPNAPASRWVDANGDGVDDRTGEPIPNMQRENIPAGANPKFRIGSNEAWGRRLLDATSGGTPQVIPQGSGWSVQDVGLLGSYQVGNQAFMGPYPTGGNNLIQGLYMGDGTPSPRGTGIWVNNDSSGNAGLTIRHAYGAGWRDNFIYGSAPPAGLSLLIDECYGYNNETASYRLNAGIVRNCVAHHDESHSGRGNRCVWAWPPGTVRVENSQLRSATGNVIEAGAHPGGSRVVVSGGVAEGRFNQRGGSINLGGGAGRSGADVTAYSSSIPGSAADAASGEASR